MYFYKKVELVWLTEKFIYISYTLLFKYLKQIWAEIVTIVPHNSAIMDPKKNYCITCGF